MTDQADLSRLADIVVPAPVPWWPPAPGWWMLLAALLAGLLILLVAAVRRWRRNAYRREALAALDRLGPATDAAGVAAISAILKRTALVAYPRAQVAPLTGRAWLAFLDRTSGTDAFTGSAASLAPAVSGVPAGDGAALRAAARRWVKHHRAEG
ncbi:DUF4381 domain-containing protein [Ancylobacter defluvii]|uniref:DUF4381 domain-containing protein n=1 Tax=Ancylobacter defluvii TaxID=1282440 RepID=A0A9W6K0R3_9HYPH|nr:DUF4381 domain-containing protein [Ancylobacter defluvii]MBS7586586.1 DUF4381 domain-containing protein [Ancylobacter defluvii]GLK85874.1 hypothetical protein GCM10017653_39440 [Ancylobacter defluvii]